MKLRQYQVDAFTRELFAGNPAAVVPLPEWIADQRMQAIAAENNLAETAFFVAEGAGYRLRWFTPVTEVDLCGHATLAAAHVLYRHLDYREPLVRFQTRSGELRVAADGDALRMDFPVTPVTACDAPAALVDGIGLVPQQVYAGEDYMAVLGSEADVRAVEPDFVRLSALDLRGVIVTAPGDEVDFVSRFFAPRYGIPEDAVTGSAHCALTPYWAGRLGGDRLAARQLSARGGELDCELRADRVVLGGHAVTFLEGEIAC